MRNWTDGALEKISAIAHVKATPSKLHSTLGRHGARAIRAAILSELAVKQWQMLPDNILKGDTTIFNRPTFPKDTIEGVGFHEAPRGTLSHWVVVEDGAIKNYQAVVPTTWNASPRDTAGTPGPYEPRSSRTPSPTPNTPSNSCASSTPSIPAWACAVHMFDSAGNTSPKRRSCEDRGHEIAVYSIGNILMGDDGVGPAVIRHLAALPLLPDILEDLGTPSLDLPAYLAFFPSRIG